MYRKEAIDNIREAIEDLSIEKIKDYAEKNGIEIDSIDEVRDLVEDELLQDLEKEDLEIGDLEQMYYDILDEEKEIEEDEA